MKRLEKTRVEVDDYDYQAEREERDSRVRAKEVSRSIQNINSVFILA